MTSETKQKKVTFAEDTVIPRTVNKCACCSFRNIKPKFRVMHLCIKCFRLTCQLCLTRADMCLQCEKRIFAAKNQDPDDYAEFSDEEAAQLIMEQLFLNYLD